MKLCSEEKVNLVGREAEAAYSMEKCLSSVWKRGGGSAVASSVSMYFIEASWKKMLLNERGEMREEREEEGVAVTTYMLSSVMYMSLIREKEEKWRNVCCCSYMPSLLLFLFYTPIYTARHAALSLRKWAYKLSFMLLQENDISVWENALPALIYTCICIFVYVCIYGDEAGEEKHHMKYMYGIGISLLSFPKYRLWLAGHLLSSVPACSSLLSLLPLTIVVKWRKWLSL